MSALRKYLKRPEAYLLVLCAMLSLAGLDSLRHPNRQVTGTIYIGAVHSYQRFGRPLLEPYIRCRYRPTCSVYSVEAVRKYGIRQGLALTVKRISSCTSEVVAGTPDPVP